MSKKRRIKEKIAKSISMVTGALAGETAAIGVNKEVIKNMISNHNPKHPK